MFGLTKEEVLTEAMDAVIKKRRKQAIIIASIVIVLIAVLLCMLWRSGYSNAKKHYENEIIELKQENKKLKDTPLVLVPVTPEIVKQTISENYTEISELATAEYAFTNSGRFTHTKHIAILPDSWSEKAFIQKWDGVIKAGIDLKKVEASIADSEIKIKIPKATILSYEIDNDSVEILDEKNNVFNPITVKDKVNFDKETSKEMKERAVKSGLLEKAQNNAKNIIESILIKYVPGIENYTISFE